MKRNWVRQNWPLVLVLSLTTYIIQPRLLRGQGDSTTEPQNSEPVYHVGNGVTAPRIIHDPNPDYPTTGRNGKKGGTVALELVVGSDGLPRDFEVVHSLSPGFDKEAINAVKKWRFAPATKDSKPVAAKINVQISFKLH